MVGIDPHPQSEAGMFNGLEVALPGELLLEGLDEALTEPVLLGRVGRSNVFLRQPVVGDHGAVAA